MITPELLKSKFESGLAFDDYVRTGDEGQVAAWKAFHQQSALSDAQRALIGGFTRRVNAVVISGVWCGDCVQQCPIFEHIERASGGVVRVRFVDRDAHMDLAEQVKICSGTRVPVCLLANEDFDFVAFEGDRVLSRYRAMAERQIGAACALPGAPVPTDQIAATVQDWVDAFERAHLICRLSTKLRQRHGD